MSDKKKTSTKKKKKSLHCDHDTGRIFGSGYSEQGEKNYESIDWSK